jgi:hypothetical protein
MSKKNRRTAKIDDPRQIELFGEDALAHPDPLVIFYQKLRRIGAYLTYDLDECRIYVMHDHDVLPRWVLLPMRTMQARIVADVKRLEHGIVEPQDEPEALAGGAVLFHLPTRRSPELEPPVRQRTTLTRRGPDVA